MAIILVLFMIIGSGCTQNSKFEPIETQLVQGLENASIETFINKDFIVIIPRIGCMGCISSSEQMLVDYAASKDGSVGFLLVDILSLKTAKMRFGEEVLSSKNVYLDSKGYFDFQDSLDIYPLVLHLKNGKILDYDIVSPDNPTAFDDLISFMSEKGT